MIGIGYSVIISFIKLCQPNEPIRYQIFSISLCPQPPPALDPPLFSSTSPHQDAFTPPTYG